MTSLIKRIRIAFLLLILFQGFHSLEEYFAKLWEVLPPAAFISGLVSSDLRTGFMIINLGIFVFGVFSFFAATSPKHIRLPGLIWGWVIVETINGIGHPLWSLLTHRYVPGTVTAPLLAVTAVYLATQLSKLLRGKSNHLNTDESTR